jgi:hypothetical protein
VRFAIYARIHTDVPSSRWVDAELDVSATQREIEFAYVPPRCEYCGDVIGVYEPLVLAKEDGHRHTSLAAEPHLFPAADPCYHGLCFELLQT